MPLRTRSRARAALIDELMAARTAQESTGTAAAFVEVTVRSPPAGRICATATTPGATAYWGCRIETDTPAPAPRLLAVVGAEQPLTVGTGLHGTPLTLVLTGDLGDTEATVVVVEATDRRWVPYLYGAALPTTVIDDLWAAIAGQSAPPTEAWRWFKAPFAAQVLSR